MIDYAFVLLSLSYYALRDTKPVKTGERVRDMFGATDSKTSAVLLSDVLEKVWQTTSRQKILFRNKPSKLLR